MSFSLNIPWIKYGIIVELTKRLQSDSPQFGKTVLQKMVYLLNEIYRVPSGYEYSLYTYGPYCSELTSDVEFVSAMGAIQLCQTHRGFVINLSDKSDMITQKSTDFINEHKEQFDDLIEKFGKFNARELELRSTLIFLARSEKMSKKLLGLQLAELKPYFAEDEISNTIDELCDLGVIDVEY